MAFIGRFGRFAFKAFPKKIVTTTVTATGTPDAFTFTDVTNVFLSAIQTSNAITVSGMGSLYAQASVVGGDMQVNGGLWGPGPVNVRDADTIAVRHTSSGGFSASVNTTLTIGTVSDTFTSTTVSLFSSAGSPIGLLLALTKAA